MLTTNLNTFNEISNLGGDLFILDVPTSSTYVFAKNYNHARRKFITGGEDKDVDGGEGGTTHDNGD